MTNGADEENKADVNKSGGSQQQQLMPAMTFTPPVISAALMPRPDPTVENQSAEDWFKIFKIVAESLIAIYTAAGQEIVGQRQALATLPMLLNRNESERRLATRIISECINHRSGRLNYPNNR